MMNSLHLYFAVVFAASILVNAEYNGTNDFNSTFEWSESQLLKIYPEGSPLLVRSLEPYVLVCKGKAEEDFTNMEWRNPNGTVIQEETSAQRGGVRKLDNSTLKLRFPSPQVEDSGEYICSATYQYTETVNASVHLHIYENIQFEECNEQQSLLLGTDGEVRCRVVGSPAPEVIWSKDDKIITSDSKYIVSADKLLIPNVTEVDQGTYVVEAFARSTGQFEHRSIKVAVQKPETTCPPDRFRCLNGECIRYWYVCNGYNDCGDWSDEINCTSTVHPPCSFDQFQCDNGRCINVSDVCDGYNDCGDWSDERNCNTTTSACLSYEFLCDNGKCIKMSYVCDGDNDCGDWSDERNCTSTTESPIKTRSTCSYWQFRCDNGRCINQIYVCDGDNDCGDWSDERGCSSTRNGWTTPSYCTSREFRCANGRCINKLYVCDGDNDCGDWSDELDCTPSIGPRCSSGMFTCRNRRCIRGRYVCDGDNDCGDWSDEIDCPSTYSYSRTTTPKLGLIIGIVVGLSVLIIVFIIAIWIVKTRKSKTQPGNVISSQPPTESHTVQQLPERRFQASHGSQPTTQSSGDLDHAPVQRFHQSATSESAIHHPAALYQTHAHGLRQPATSPSEIEEQGNLHTGVVHDMHLAPHSQIPQSNLYPVLPQQTYPTAPESSSS